MLEFGSLHPDCSYDNGVLILMFDSEWRYSLQYLNTYQIFSFSPVYLEHVKQNNEEEKIENKTKQTEKNKSSVPILGVLK